MYVRVLNGVPHFSETAHFSLFFFFLCSLDCIISLDLYFADSFFFQPKSIEPHFTKFSYQFQQSATGWLQVVLNIFKLVMFSPFTVESVLCGLETVFTVQFEFVLYSAIDQGLRCSLSFCTSSEVTALAICIVFQNVRTTMGLTGFSDLSVKVLACLYFLVVCL